MTTKHPSKASASGSRNRPLSLVTFDIVAVLVLTLISAVVLFLTRAVCNRILVSARGVDA